MASRRAGQERVYMGDKMQSQAYGGCREDKRAWTAGSRQGGLEMLTHERWSWTGGGEAWGRERARGHGGPRGGGDDGWPAWQRETRG